MKKIFIRLLSFFVIIFFINSIISTSSTNSTSLSDNLVALQLKLSNLKNKFINLKIALENLNTIISSGSTSSSSSDSTSSIPKPPPHPGPGLNFNKKTKKTSDNWRLEKATIELENQIRKIVPVLNTIESQKDSSFYKKYGDKFESRITELKEKSTHEKIEKYNKFEDIERLANDLTNLINEIEVIKILEHISTSKHLSGDPVINENNIIDDLATNLLNKKSSKKTDVKNDKDSITDRRKAIEDDDDKKENDTQDTRQIIYTDFLNKKFKNIKEKVLLDLVKMVEEKDNLTYQKIQKNLEFIKTQSKDYRWFDIITKKQSIDGSSDSHSKLFESIRKGAALKKVVIDEIKTNTQPTEEKSSFLKAMEAKIDLAKKHESTKTGVPPSEPIIKPNLNQKEEVKNILEQIENYDMDFGYTIPENIDPKAAKRFNELLSTEIEDDAWSIVISEKLESCDLKILFDELKDIKDKSLEKYEKLIEIIKSTKAKNNLKPWYNVIINQKLPADTSSIKETSSPTDKPLPSTSTASSLAASDTKESSSLNKEKPIKKSEPITKPLPKKPSAKSEAKPRSKTPEPKRIGKRPLPKTPNEKLKEKPIENVKEYLKEKSSSKKEPQISLPKIPDAIINESPAAIKPTSQISENEKNEFVKAIEKITTAIPAWTFIINALNPVKDIIQNNMPEDLLKIITSNKYLNKNLEKIKNTIEILNKAPGTTKNEYKNIIDILDLK